MTKHDNEKDRLGPPPLPPWWRRPVVLVVVGVVLVAAAGFGVNTLLHACGGLGSGVTEVDGECVGVTDGSYVFDPTFADIEEKIRKENEKVKGSGHTVTVALLEPLTADETSARTNVDVHNKLEAAYVAQHSANQPGLLGDPYPLIRLVLANEGSHEYQWQPVVRQLEEMVGDADPLVAVTGLGVSITETLAGTKDLAAHGIPMVGASGSADELNYTNVHGFIRVTPSNREYVQSLSDYLRYRSELDSAILVFDSNADDPVSPDLFVRSLRDDLLRGMSELIKFPALSYTGQSGRSAANPNMFRAIRSDLCSVKPKVVLFGGRQRDLLSFRTALEGRPCPDTPMTVLTIATDLGELNNDEAMLREKKITVAYATARDPHGWVDKVPGTPAHFGDFLSGFLGQGFALADLDGEAIATHDAIFTAVSAIRLAVPQGSSGQFKVPKAADVLGQLLNLHGDQNKVPGASGDLSFSFRSHDPGNPIGDASGDPSGKSIPVLEIPPSGPFSAAAGPLYVTP